MNCYVLSYIDCDFH